MKIEISEKYLYLREYIESLPGRIDSEGETVHDGRNLIKVFTTADGLRLNVKRYHAPRLLNAVVYSTGLRKPKGLRAYEYPARLIAAGIETPEAVAYIEERCCGLLGKSYFVSVQCPYRHRFYEVLDMPSDEYLPLAESFARFTASMHKAGMLHRDYSPGNILWTRDGGVYRFSIVDINRMFFGNVSVEAGCANFARLWGTKAFFTAIARIYAKERGTDEKKCIDAVLSARRSFWRKYARHHDVSFMPEID